MQSQKVRCYEDFKKEVISLYSSPYEAWYHEMHLRFMRQKKLKLSLRQFALKLHKYAVQHQIPDDRSLLATFICNMEHQYRKATLDIIGRRTEQTGEDPTMLEMTKLAGEIEDAAKLAAAADQSQPWAELGGYAHNSSDTDSNSSDSSDEEEVQKKRKRARARKPNTKPKGKQTPSRSTDKTCKIHGKSSHSTDECYDVTKLAQQRHSNNSTQGFKPRAKLTNPCKFCNKVNYFKGHMCPEMRKHNADND
jgi:hypothetical protein